MNLQDYRKQKYQTIKAFAEAYGCSPSKASMLLHGRHQMTLNKEEVQKLADILGVSFKDCVHACDASFAEFRGYSEVWGVYATHENLEYIWQWREELLNAAKQARDTRYWYEQEKRNYRDPIDRLFAPLLAEECFQQLGLSAGATPEQVKQAFRTKVKAMADGKGGYVGDMDKLVQAKEKALEYASQ